MKHGKGTTSQMCPNPNPNQTPHAELIFLDKCEIIYISSFSEKHFSLYLTKEKVNGTDFWQDCAIYLLSSPGLLTLSVEEFQFLFLEGVTMKTSNETFYLKYLFYRTLNYIEG